MKSIFILSIGLLLCLPITAQSKEKKEIETLKIAFINKALDLSAEKAQKFWPIYTKYEAIADSLSTDLHCHIYDKLEIIESIPPEEAKVLLENYMKLRLQEYKLRKNYVAALEKVISAKKIMMLKKAEYNFHRKLLEKYRSGEKE